MAMDVIEAIMTRRSIRKYKPDPVSDKDLNTILEAARWAPSWANTQCTRFIVVRDRTIKDNLGDTLLGNSGKNALNTAPLAIVGCAELKKAGYKEGVTRTDKGDWFMFDVALAMHNLVLAAQALGLGTVYLGLFDAVKAAKVLKVPDGFAVVAMTPLGYPDEQVKAPARKQLSEIVFNNHWGETPLQHLVEH
jgi:nitroreductase